MVVDPSNYKIAVELADAAAKQAEVTAQNAEREAEGRRKLNDLAVTVEQRQTYDTEAVAAQARCE